MAGVIARSAFAISKRPSLIVASNRGAQKSFNFTVMADPLEHATGLERKELEEIKKGNIDPFNMSVIKRAVGTRDQPTLIPSSQEKRMVGCVCHEDAFYVNFLWLHKGEPSRCECGYWFKLIEKKDFFE